MHENQHSHLELQFNEQNNKADLNFNFGSSETQDFFNLENDQEFQLEFIKENNSDIQDSNQQTQQKEDIFSVKVNKGKQIPQQQTSIFDIKVGSQFNQKKAKNKKQKPTKRRDSGINEYKNNSILNSSTYTSSIRKKEKVIACPICENQIKPYKINEQEVFFMCSNIQCTFLMDDTCVFLLEELVCKKEIQDQYTPIIKKKIKEFISKEDEKASDQILN